MRREWMAAVAGLAVSVAGAAALGQNQPGGPAAGPKDKPAAQNGTPGQPHAQPDAQPAGEARTLVRRDAEGKLIRQSSPELGAVEIMPLTDAEIGRIKAIVTERRATIDEIVLKNLDLLTRLHNAIKAGDEKEERAVYFLYAAKAERLNDRGKLEDEIKPQLRLDHVEEFTKLVNEYRQALLQDAARVAKAESKTGKVDMQKLANNEMTTTFGYEIQLSYGRTVGASPTDLDSVVSKLTLTSEQETAVRAVVKEYQAYAGKATHEQKRDVMMKIIEVLDAQQRVQFVKLVQEGEWGAVPGR